MQPNTDTAFKWVETDNGADYPEHEGTAVWTRPDLARATHARAMRDLHGIRTIAEVDDNYLNPPRSKSGYTFNYFMVTNRMDETARMDHMKSCASMDGIVVTTEWLAATYEKTLRKELGVCPPIFVCGNHVELDRWPERVESESGRLRVGWMGSPSHVYDVKLAFPALKWAADQGHEVVLIGYDPKWRRFMDYTHVPWTLPEEYRRAGLPLDVALAPLRYDRHTLGKSDCKALEYLMAGAAPVLQAHPVYTQAFRHEETCLLGNSREELLAATMRLCGDRGLRESLVAAGQEYVREERDIRKHTDEWLEAIRGD